MAKDVGENKAQNKGYWKDHHVDRRCNFGIWSVNLVWGNKLNKLNNHRNDRW